MLVETIGFCAKLPVILILTIVLSPLLKIVFVKVHFKEKVMHDLGKLFTANQDLIITKVGELKQNVLKQIIDAVTEMLYSGFKV